ncbi:MAG: diguanylate cyclase [Eubacteriales bacterium]
MIEKIYKMLVKALDHSSQAVFLFDKSERNPFFTNKQAITHFADENGLIDVYNIFEGKASPFLHSAVTEHLESNGYAMMYDVPVISNGNNSEICDVQVAYADDERKSIMVELYFKKDNRMDMAYSQVNISTRAEAILNYDEKLSIVHCNDLFYDVFEANEEIRHALYENNLSNGFQPELRKELLAEIHNKLDKTAHFHSKMKVITSKDETLWYSLELHRRILDDSGIDKVMAYMVNIEKEVEKEAEFEENNQYFNVLQSLSKGILYRFDLKTRTLYRNEEASKTYNAPRITENFPSQEWLKEFMHPEDVAKTILYGESLAEGKECTLTARVRVSEGVFEYHNFIFKPVYREDGSVKEMIGCTNNVHNLTETKNELENVNQYFTAIQSLSNDMLYLVDIKSKTLRRTTEQAELMGIPEVLSNYPDSVCDTGLIHPEDVELYRDFGNLLLQGKGTEAEVRMKLKNGGYGFHRLLCTPVYKPDGTVKEMFGKVLNVQKERNLEEQANYDALTHVLNKRAVLDFTSDILKDSTSKSKHALFFMDLDNFKGANDNLGHVFGDYLLEELGQRLKDSIRTQDLVGRVGGDEFVIFLRDVPNADILMGKAKMLLSTISEDFSDGEVRHSIHGSLGVAVYPDHGISYEELYHRADIALYHSKKKGKNMVTIYDPSLTEG